jgi:lipid-binding SYLF domain-containing protein
MTRKLVTHVQWPALLAFVLLLAGPVTAQSDKKKDRKAEQQAKARADLERKAEEAIKVFRKADSTLDEFFESAVAYAIFPEISKGGFVIGGAAGKGVLYERAVNDEGEAIKDENGEPVWKIAGYCSMAQGTVGAQIGGQKYYQLIFFENEAVLSTFKEGTAELSAQASAVAAKEGAATSVDYEDGVAIFTRPRGGLMAEASVGGQKFSFEPKETAGAEK